MIIYIYVTRNIFYITKMPSARIWRCAKQKIAGAAVKRTLSPRVLQKGVKPSHDRLSHKPNVNHSNSCAVNAALITDIISLTAYYRIINAPNPACSTSSLFPPLPSLAFPPPYPKQSNNNRFLDISKSWFARSIPVIQRLYHSLLNRLISIYDYTLIPINISFLSKNQSIHAITVLSDAATALSSTHNLTATNKILIALDTVTPSTNYILAQKLRQLLMQHLFYLWKLHSDIIIVTFIAPCASWQIERPKMDLKSGLSDENTTQSTMEYTWMINFLSIPALSVSVGFMGVEGENGIGVETDERNISVGLIKMGEWASEESLLDWTAHAEVIKADRRRKPEIWVDVIERARVAMQSVGDEGNIGDEEAVRKRR